MNLLRFLLRIVVFCIFVAATYAVSCTILVYILGFSEAKTGGPDGTYRFFLELTSNLILATGLGFALPILALSIQRDPVGLWSRCVGSALAAVLIGTGFCVFYYPWALLFVPVLQGLAVSAAILGVAVELVCRALERTPTSLRAGASGRA